MHVASGTYPICRQNYATEIGPYFVSLSSELGLLLNTSVAPRVGWIVGRFYGSKQSEKQLRLEDLMSQMSGEDSLPGSPKRWKRNYV